MDKFTVTIPRTNWKGLKTKYPFDSPFVSQDDLLAGSKNLDTTIDGALTKCLGGTSYATIAHANKDQYEAIFSNGVHHLLVVENGVLRFSPGDHSFAQVTAGYTATANMEFASYQDRVYFGNGIDAAQVYDLGTSYGGVTYTAPQTKAMGAQAPASAPTAPATGSGAAGSVPDGAHTYKVTYLYYGAEESNGSTASGVCTVTGPNSTVALTAIPVGGYGVTARKVYRDNNDGAWLLVGTISNNTATTFSDTASIGTAAIPTTNNVPPLFDLIVQHRDRFFMKTPSAPSVLWWTDAGHPNIVNPNNFVVCDPKDPITALTVYNDRVIIHNRNSMGQLLGNTSATFQYSKIPSSVGCVDNRTVQIAATKGVPALIWLSDKGYYRYNGSSIDYISEEIEDQINFNIVQAQQVKGRNTQSTTAEFQGGTASVGLTVADGSVTTINPISQFQTMAAFKAGTIANLITEDGSGSLQVPLVFDPAVADGSLSGSVEISGVALTLPVRSDDSGTHGASSVQTGTTPSAYHMIATRYSVSGPGTITSLSARVTDALDHEYQLMVWSDSGGSIGSVLGSGTIISGPVGVDALLTSSVSIHVPAAGLIWVGLRVLVGSDTDVGGTTILRGVHMRTVGISGFLTQYRHSVTEAQTSLFGVQISASFNFSQSAVPQSGLWISPVFDSEALAATVDSLVVTGTYGSSATGIITVIGGTSATAFDVQQSLTNPNGTVSVSLADRRFFKIQVQLVVTDDRDAISIGESVLRFNTTGTWTSAAIDTKEPTTYAALTDSQSVPAGTSAALTISTSDDDITYTAFVAFGSVSVKRYAKLRLTLTANAGHTLTASVNSVSFSWNLSSTFVSSAIDTGVVPAGWELFVSDFQLHGGTVTFYTRTATTSGGLGAASYTAVTNGTFITSDVHEWVQWKAVFTATANNQPVINDVTINWFITNIQSIRAASIFWNRNYYVAVAPFGSTTNTLVYIYDAEGNWHRYEDLGINTFSYFFNAPYYGASAEGRVVLFDNGATKFGTAITMDARFPVKIFARTPADLEDKVKILRHVTAIVKGTGATYAFYYSVDGGSTWVLLYDVVTGTGSFTPANDGLRHVCRMVPHEIATGRSFLLRVVDSSLFSAEVRSIKARVWVREQEVYSSNG